MICSNIISGERLSKFKFQWQEGFSAFSYSHSALDRVISYIHNQREHLTKKTFKEEYLGFLHKFKIVYNNQYLLDLIDQQKPQNSIVHCTAGYNHHHQKG